MGEPSSIHPQTIREWGWHYASGFAPWDIDQPCPELRKRLPELALPKGAKTLDLGCGTGSNTIYLAEQGYHSTGVDSEPLAIERAQARADRAGVPVDLVLDDLLAPATKFGIGYEFLFDRGCYHYVRLIDVQAYLETLQRLTQPGSQLLVLAGNAEEPFPDGPPVVTEAEIRDELGSIFEVQWIQRFRLATCSEDRRPAGWSCLLVRTG